MNALSFLVDPEYWKAVRDTAPNSLANLSKGLATGVVGAPVDIANMVLKPVGLGSDTPVGGSNWLGRFVDADTNSSSYQIGQALPISPEQLTVGAKFAIPALTAITKESRINKLSDLFRPLDAVQYPVGTKYSPVNKYIENPNFNSRYLNGVDGVESGNKYTLPTPDEYRRIENAQKAESEAYKNKLDERMRKAIEVDSRHPTSNGDVQHPSAIQGGIDGEEWLKRSQAEVDYAMKIRQPASSDYQTMVDEATSKINNLLERTWQ